MTNIINITSKKLNINPYQIEIQLILNLYYQT